MQDHGHHFCPLRPVIAYGWDGAGAIAVHGRMVNPVEVIENATGPKLSKPILLW